MSEPTHRYASAVRLARLDGMVPLSWLLLKSLQRQETQRCSRRRTQPHTHSPASPVRLPRPDGMVLLS